MYKISVIMPVYNTEEEYLREAIESILSQTYTDFEFIIINDGSTNNVEEVVLSYKDKRINYVINEENLGLIKTLNKGLSIAKGEYIARMDSDDISLPTRLEKQAYFLEQNKDIDILGTWLETFPEIEIIKKPAEDCKIKEFMLFRGCAIGHPTVMMRKSTIDKYGFKYNERDKHAEDYGLWFSMMDKVKFANIPEILLKYRWHECNISKLNSEIQRGNTIRLKVKAQGDILKINTENILKAMEKITQGQKINSTELADSIPYFIDLIEKMQNSEDKDLWMKDTRLTYQFLVKRTKRDAKFLNILWYNRLNKLIRNSFYFKLKSNLKGWK